MKKKEKRKPTSFVGKDELESVGKEDTFSGVVVVEDAMCQALVGTGRKEVILVQKRALKLSSDV